MSRSVAPPKTLIGPKMTIDLSIVASRAGIVATIVGFAFLAVSIHL